MAKFIDIHSHIAWGIDDGMPSIEDAQSALESAKADGFVGICSTPHFIPGQLDVSIYNEIVSRQMELKEMSPIPIYCGGEVMMNSEFIDGLDMDLYPTLNGSRYMLVEYNVLRDIHSIDYRDDCLYELKVKGFVPVIAHIERYFHSGLDYSIIDNYKLIAFIKREFNYKKVWGAFNNYLGKCESNLIDELIRMRISYRDYLKYNKYDNRCSLVYGG